MCSVFLIYGETKLKSLTESEGSELRSSVCLCLVSFFNCLVIFATHDTSDVVQLNAMRGYNIIHNKQINATQCD